MMRFEYDTGVNALYIYVREIPDGAAARQIELQEGVYLDADEEGRTFGMEFLDIEDFLRWLARNNGDVAIPRHISEARARGLTPA
jgi:uncharacterized protein YuzE